MTISEESCSILIPSICPKTTEPIQFFILSAAHSKEDIDQTMKAFADSLDAMMAEGTLKIT